MVSKLNPMASEVSAPKAHAAVSNARQARRRRLRWVAVALITTGIVVATVTRVDARDIGHASVIAVRTSEGQEWQFAVDDAVDMTPGHLREHMMFGELVTVTARPAAKGTELPIAVIITD